MASLQVIRQSTPNPNALKFIVNVTLKNEGKADFSSVTECEHVPLAEELLHLPGVKQVHFFDNVVTVTQDGSQSWDTLAEMVEGTVYSLGSEHDPDFANALEVRRSQMSDEQKQVEDILDQHIRPYLQGDGGDLEVVDIDGCIISIRYQGACGTCPSAVTGTLQAIQSVLQENFREDVEVVTV